MISAVDLDELLRNITPEMAAKVRVAVPTAYADQFDAARAESTAIVQAVEGKPVWHAAADEVADWLRLGILDTFLRWASGKARTCEHRPTSLKPQAVWSAAWHSGLVVCTQCIPMLQAVSEIEDRRCDCCGHVCEGVEADDPIYTQTVWLGALAYQAGACKHCRDDGPARLRRRPIQRRKRPQRRRR